jgi:hypothetical protein
VRRALIVGVDDYPGAPLSGCVNDARAIEALLSRNQDGAVNFESKLLTSDRGVVDRAALLGEIERLFADEADVALLYFAGHGTENDLGGYLVTVDASRYNEGVSLSDVLTLANDSRAHEVVIILDSCHSGHLGQIPAIDNRRASLREGVSILTASRSTQAAAEEGNSGLFTGLVCAALAGGAADVLGKVTVAAVYAYVDESLGAWQQRPLFKSHVSRLLPLRLAEPRVRVEILRRLPEWFPDPERDFGLDPSYEPEAGEEHADPEHEEIFGCLQSCARAHLIVPVGQPHMYHAAINSTACRLTPLGGFYWKLAHDGLI